MSQAILTRVLPPTNTRGARIKATCARGSLTTDANGNWSSEENHKDAACQLCARFLEEDATQYGSPKDGNPWGRPLITGTIASGDYVHVFAEDETTREMRAVLIGFVALANAGLRPQITRGGHPEESEFFRLISRAGVIVGPVKGTK